MHPFSGRWGMPHYYTARPLALWGRAMPHPWNPYVTVFGHHIGGRGYVIFRALPAASIPRRMPYRHRHNFGLGGGVDVIYPAGNAQLTQQIRENGLQISEQPKGTQPQARHFPVRNRLISGLSQAIVVIEAAAKSGSLITAKTALDQGRDVYAVPGHPFDARASGCNI